MKYKNELLNGEWLYIVDTGNEFTVEEIQSKIENNNDNKFMQVPGNWHLQGLPDYNGVVWFIRKFSGDIFSPNSLNILEFAGVDYFADVWLNQKYIGSHEGYFQTFEFEISSKLNYSSTNYLFVKVNSPFEDPETVWPMNKKLIKGIFNHHDCRPGGVSKIHGQDGNTGGLWNDVAVHSVTKVYFKNLRTKYIIQSERKKAKLEILADYIFKKDQQENFSLNIELINPSGKTIHSFKTDFAFNAAGVIKFFIDVENPELWMPWEMGKANLYEIKISSGYSNPISRKFGFKTVKLEVGTNFYINEKRLFLRGTNIIPEQYLSKLDKSRIKKLVSLMKEANINIVRVHAHITRKEFYEECDEQGLLVWQDFPLQWGYDHSNEFIVNAVCQIKDMVLQLGNFASVAFWCCHNEPGDQVDTLDKYLYDAVKSLDESRIIRISSNYEEHPYDGWYWGIDEHYAGIPMGPLVTEFGAQALPGLDSLKKIFNADELFPANYDLWKYHNFQPNETFNIAKIDKGNSISEFIENSQAYQARLIKKAIHYYRREKGRKIGGVFQFMFSDCWPSITWSVIDYYLEKKSGYTALQKAFSPLLLSVNLRQDQYFPGTNLNIDLWIINDCYKKFSDLEVSVFLDEQKIGAVVCDFLSEDSVWSKRFDDIKIEIPEIYKPGQYELKFILSGENTEKQTEKFLLRIKVLEK